MEAILAKIKSLWPKLSPGDRPVYLAHATLQNVGRMRAAARLAIVMMLAMAVVQWFMPEGSLLKRAWLTHTILRGVFILICGWFLLAVGRPRSVGDIRPRHHWAVWAAAAGLNCLAGVWVGLLQVFNPSITFYLLMVFLMAVLATLPPVQSALVFGLGLGCMLVFVPWFQAQPDLVSLNLVNGVALTILAYFMAQLNYAASVRRFLDHMVIQRQAKELEELSLQDALTGLANRRRLDLKLNEEWNRGIRDGRPLSVILIDIDHFKLYNDTYGHGAGDICLKRVARAIDLCAQRAGDLAARYGGEEFLVILPETGASGAEKIGQFLAQGIWDADIHHQESEYGRVTVSLGIATMVCQNDKDPYDLVEAADRAMYQAKELGRNRLCKAEGPPEDPCLNLWLG